MGMFIVIVIHPFLNVNFHLIDVFKNDRVKNIFSKSFIKSLDISALHGLAFLDSYVHNVRVLAIALSNGIRLIRTKTETPRQSEQQEIYIPLTDELRYYLNKVAIPEEVSPFVLGKLHKGYSEQSLVNRKNRFRQEINPELRRIRDKLNLGAPLVMASSRDCYASSLDRQQVSRSTISEMLGHQDLRTTNHYLDSLSPEKAHAINKQLVSSKKEFFTKNRS